MSTFQVHYDTKQRYDSPVVHAKQSIEVPVRYVEDVKISYGRHRVVIREVTALGTVEVEHYGVSRVEYGKCFINKHIVFVVKNGTSWRAVERMPIEGCIA